MAAPVSVQEFVRPRDLAKKWGCCRQHILDLARREGIPVVSMGHRTRRILAEDVERLQALLIKRATKEAK